MSSLDGGHAPSAGEDRLRQWASKGSPPLLAGIGAFLVYAVLAQETFFKSDGHYILVRYLRGEAPYPNHPLNELLLSPFAHALEALGVPAYSAVLLFSSVGTALAVAFFVASSSGFGLTRGKRILSGMVLCLTPGLLFFATVIEFHGPFMAFAGFAWLSATRIALRGTWPWILLASTASALAASMHSTGHLLTIVVMTAILTIDTGDRVFSIKKRILLSSTYLIAHILVSICITLILNHWLFSGFGDKPRPSALSYLIGHGHLSLDTIVHRLPWSVLGEYLLPFIPLSLLPLLAFKKEYRRDLLAFLLPLPAYIFLCLILLGSEQGHEEFGAYVLPLAFPLAFATARIVRTWQLVSIGIIAAAFSLVTIAESDRGEIYRQRIQRFEATAAPMEPMVWCQDLDSLGSILRYRPLWRWELCHIFSALPVQVIQGNVELLDSMSAGWIEKHQRLIITSSGIEELKSTPGGTLLCNLIREKFDVSIQEDGLWSVRPK